MTKMVSVGMAGDLLTLLNDGIVSIVTPTRLGNRHRSYVVAGCLREDEHLCVALSFSEDVPLAWTWGLEYDEEYSRPPLRLDVPSDGDRAFSRNIGIEARMGFNPGDEARVGLDIEAGCEPIVVRRERHERRQLDHAIFFFGREIPGELCLAVLAGDNAFAIEWIDEFQSICRRIHERLTVPWLRFDAATVSWLSGPSWNLEFEWPGRDALMPHSIGDFSQIQNMASIYQEVHQSLQPHKADIFVLAKRVILLWRHTKTLVYWDKLNDLPINHFRLLCICKIVLLK